MNKNKWQDVPDEYILKWRKIFSNNKQGITLLDACPVCGKHSLHQYYHMHKRRERIINQQKFIGDGGLWCWCSSCKCYEHYSGAVPEWWNCEIKIDESLLTHAPDIIEQALNNNK